jgi:hypothetical protein
MSEVHAARYRRLAVIEQDNEKAQLLRLIADESDQGVLFTVDWKSAPARVARELRPQLSVQRWGLFLWPRLIPKSSAIADFSGTASRACQKPPKRLVPEDVTMEMASGQADRE